MSRIFDYSIPALFELVSPAVAAALEGASHQKHFREGETIHSQDEAAEVMGWVEEGAIAFGKYSDKDGFLSLVELGEGHHFGEYIALREQPRRLAAQAIGATVIRIVSKEKLVELVDTYPELLKAFLTISSEKLNVVLECYDDARRLASPQRIAKILLILNRRRSEGTALPFTQADLSTVLGISKVTVNQTLKKLEERGILETGYRHIRVRSLQQLRQFAASS